MTRRLLARAGAAAFLFVIAGVPAAGVQTIDDLVAKNLTAKGGAEKIKAVQTLKQTARVGMQGMELTIVAYGKRPNLMRQEMNLNGQTMVMAFDGTTAWQINPMAGATSPVAMTGPEAQMAKDQADFDGPLMDYKTKGHVVELIGTEALGTRRVHHLKVTSTNKRVTHVYLDSETGLEAKIVIETPAGNIEQVFSDYRTVDGLKFPFLVKSTGPMGQTDITVDKIEVNPKIDDAIFKLPKT